MDNAVILPVPTNVTSDELRRDPVRKVSRLLVGVKFREGANCKVLAGVRWMPERANDEGWQEAEIYEDDLPRLHAAVFDDADAMVRAQAGELLLERKREFVAEREGVTLDRIPEDPSDWTKRQTRLAKLFPGSLEEEIFRLNKRGTSKPFVAVKVLENRGIPKSDQEELLTRFAQATGTGAAQSEAMTQMLSMLTQVVQQQSEMLATFGKRIEALEKPRAKRSMPAEEEHT